MFQIPFIAMYRKEQCLSLLTDPDQGEIDDNNVEKSERNPTIKWHKVNGISGEQHFYYLN